MQMHTYLTRLADTRERSSVKPTRQIQEIVTIQLYYFGDFKISHFVVCESEEEKRASPSPALLLPTARLKVAPPSLPGEGGLSPVW